MQLRQIYYNLLFDKKICIAHISNKYMTIMINLN